MTKNQLIIPDQPVEQPPDRGAGKVSVAAGTGELPGVGNYNGQGGESAEAVGVAAALGVFGADHIPEPDSFRRARRWLFNGYDVVQGHALVRNGDASTVARLVAVKLEAIYAVSHPGRARLHDFGILGGSNGYWRTDPLRATRMRGSMLTEDIDSSMRVTGEGHRIANDPLLISRELSPTTWRALWNQRMRWAQGWFQVSMRPLRPVLHATHLSVRQKAGALFLLGWRKIYPWISLQMFPIIAHKAYSVGGVGQLIAGALGSYRRPTGSRAAAAAERALLQDLVDVVTLTAAVAELDCVLAGGVR